jgi:hypothetical protein
MEAGDATVQDLFRTVNERLHQRMLQLAVPGRAPLICECRDGKCLQLIELTSDEYRAVRSSPERYLVLPGHAQPEFERVVETRDGFDIVEKAGGRRNRTGRAEPPDSPSYRDTQLP